MSACPSCQSEIDLRFEGFGQPIRCEDCGSGPYRLRRLNVWLLILGAAAYLPVMGFVAVEVFGMEPSKLVMGRHQQADATTGTLIFFLGAIAWLVFWWRLWKKRYAAVH